MRGATRDAGREWDVGCDVRCGGATWAAEEGEMSWGNVLGRVRGESVMAYPGQAQF